MNYLDPVLNFFSSNLAQIFIGILGSLMAATIAALAVKLYGARKFAEKSKIEFARELDQQATKIRDLEQLIAKANADQQLFNDLLPETTEGIHTLFHELINFPPLAPRLKSEALRQMPDHLSSYPGPPLCQRFIARAASLIARTKLLDNPKHPCARTLIGSEKLNEYLVQFMSSDSKVIQALDGHTIDSQTAMLDIEQLKHLERVAEHHKDRTMLDSLLATEFIMSTHRDVPIGQSTRDSLARDITISLTSHIGYAIQQETPDHRLERFKQFPNTSAILALHKITAGTDPTIAGLNNDTLSALSESPTLHPRIADFLKPFSTEPPINVSEGNNS